ncbi:hypothetical protein H2204_001307 [Knufia peltigerae]|uniref:Major facilitator superfamily (MFS) profile domain-containing protein n=1 Tax=Knufia peltigerae TaxID=1002370 RepID=A0AA38YD21_9EURO|nr:hypothetical protein H2204_001307 [Knufia peltigerae]
MTLTLLGDVFLGTFLTLVADRVGRRRVLMAGSGLMVLTGVVFALFENFWVLLVAAILGVVSVTGGDFGPFRSIEESMLSQLTTPSSRSDVLAWYVTTSTLGSSIGSEVSGRVIHFLQDRPGWRPVDAYHALFWVYTLMGIVNAVLVLPLTKECELEGLGSQDENYVEIAQEENDDDEVDDTTLQQRQNRHQHDQDLTGRREQDEPEPEPEKGGRSRLRNMSTWFGRRFAQVSAPTRAIMYKLWFLLAVDSLADGMVPYSLTNYFMDVKFHPTKSALGDVTSIAYFLGAVGAVFAGPLARNIGLINTMVFTHVPSSAAVLLFPFPPWFWLTSCLLLVRAGLNNMDQAPRSAFIAAVVQPQERTAVMGITAMVRTLAAMAGPSVTGALAADDRFWIAFLVAGVCRLAYDFGLYAMFVNMRLYQHEENDDDDRTTTKHAGLGGEATTRRGGGGRRRRRQSQSSSSSSVIPMAELDRGRGRINDEEAALNVGMEMDDLRSTSTTVGDDSDDDDKNNNSNSSKIITS